MAGRFELTLWEYGTEAKASKVSVHMPELDETNYAVQAVLWADFSDACKAVSLGNTGKEVIVSNDDGAPRNPSLNPVAQRENKWLVTCAESGTGNLVTFTIPCYDPSLLAPDGVSMDTTSPEYAALVAATLAFVRSNDGNTVSSVVSIKFRARTI